MDCAFPIFEITFKIVYFFLYRIFPVAPPYRQFKKKKKKGKIKGHTDDCVALGPGAMHGLQVTLHGISICTHPGAANNA